MGVEVPGRIRMIFHYACTLCFDSEVDECEEQSDSEADKSNP